MRDETGASEHGRPTYGVPRTVPATSIFTEPYYLILFKSSAGRAPYRPVVDATAYSAADATLPYGLDRELAATLPAMWYCLHLPRARFDLTDIHAKGMKAFQLLELPHHIIPLPVPWPEPLPLFRPSDWPAIILAPRELRSAASRLASLVPAVCDIADTEALNIGSLQRHWTALYAALHLDQPRYVWPSRIFLEFTQRALLLPNLFLARQLRGGRDEEIPVIGPTKATVMAYSTQCQVVLSATARLEEEGVSLPEAEARFPQAIAEERRNFRCPVALLLPGLARGAASRRVARQRTHGGLRSDGSTDARVESTALEFLAAHRAAARFGVSVNAASVSDQAFMTLETLERMFDGCRVSPRKVTKYLDRLSHQVVAGLTTEERFALLHASSITSFSEFPIGLVTIPPDTSPLCCRTPIAYRPLCPLTRALQFETLAVPMIYLREGLTILCLECIPREDPVGRLSRAGWNQASEELRDRSDVVFDFVEVDSIASLREALKAREYHILVISAHGFYDRGTNRTGFSVGLRDVVLQHELGDLPPLVCLAACQVAPRGAGSLNITDLLFRQGAVAVLGTLVPINVRRNAHLMVRFFIYIAETLDGANSLRSIDEVWQFTATSNAVLDVILGARTAADWMWEEWNGCYGIKDFMLTQSVGRIRKGHVYSDTEVVMQEMAAERGKEAPFKAWLANQGYVPESIFYTLLGWPERLILCDREFERARDFYGGTPLPSGGAPG